MKLKWYQKMGLWALGVLFLSLTMALNTPSESKTYTFSITSHTGTVYQTNEYYLSSTRSISFITASGRDVMLFGNITIEEN